MKMINKNTEKDKKKKCNNNNVIELSVSGGV